MAKKPDAKKAARHEAKGDEHLQKGKHKKALGEYRKALEYAPDSADIYEKLIKAKDEAGEEWDLKDFAESVSRTMEKQEQDNPNIRQVHAMLSPEWKEATELILKLLAKPAGEESGEEIERLVEMGEISTRALIGVLLSLKRGPEEKTDEGEPSREESEGMEQER